MKLRSVALCLSLAFLIAGCSSKQANTQNQSQTADKANSELQSAHSQPTDTNTSTSAPSTHMEGATIVVAGISVTAPTDWKRMSESPMRKGSFAFGPIEGDADSATLGIYYFGENQGGGVSENVSRWLGQMEVPGGDVNKAAKETEATYCGLKVHLLEIAGTYKSPVGGPMSSKTIPKENYLMSGAIVEAPDGLVFFKLTGPMKTATKMNDAMKAMVAQLKTIG